MIVFEETMLPDTKLLLLQGDTEAEVNCALKHVRIKAEW